MRASELLLTISRWLSSPDCEAILLAEDDLECLDSVAASCVSAAAILKRGAEEAAKLEPAEEPKLTPEALDHLNLVISAFDQSGDKDLQKTASVIDELLLSVCAKPQWVSQYKEAEEKKIDEMTKKYKGVNEQLHKENRVAESAAAIDKSPMFAEPRKIAPSLSTRCCPDHSGVLLSRVADHTWQCQLDKKQYNWQTGFTDMKGNKIPGGDPSQQFEFSNREQPHQLFDGREERLNGYVPDKR